MIIEPDSPFAQELGFTSNKFRGWLGKQENFIYISFIESVDEGQGNLSKLFNRILELGYSIKVPTPLGLMRKIVQKKGFTQTMEPFDPEHGIYDPCEVWVLNGAKIPAQNGSSLR